MPASGPYNRQFYEELRTGAKRSASVIVPIILELTKASSVVDVGCGDGSWLAAFRDNGVEEILGIDGDYIDLDLLQIPKEKFRAQDLAKPFAVEQEFDLAVSLEVVEHLPASSAAQFVAGLTKLAPIVVFSAAIPFQGGTGHLNEQWQDSWASLFKENDYLPIDCIRKRVWQNDQVEWWYAQNTLLFGRTDAIETIPALKVEFEQTNPNQLALVHPRQYLHLESKCREGARASQPPMPPGVRAASRLLLHCMRKAVKSRFSRSSKNL